MSDEDRINSDGIKVDVGPVAADRTKRMEGKEEPLEVKPPLEYGTPYINLEQAAFLMQEPEEVVTDWISKGLLLAVKMGRAGGRQEYQIHQSELNRFRHPWKHIWRIDERISGFQNLVETLKQRINMDDTALRDEVSRTRRDLLCLITHVNTVEARNKTEILRLEGMFLNNLRRRKSAKRAKPTTKSARPVKKKK